MSIWARVEEQYAIKIRETVRVHDVYKIRTTNASYCFKRYLFPEEDVRFITRVFVFLDEQGFERSQKVYPTVEHNTYLTHDGMFYTLTNWVEGDRPRFEKPSDFKTAIRTLAKFHLHAEGFPAEAAPASRVRYFGLRQEISEYRSLLSGDRHAAHLVPLCEEAAFLLDQPFAFEAIASEQSLSAFVHGDYNYPNLIKDRHHKMHLIDFDNTSLSLRMQDLSHILQRNCVWDSSSMLRLIDYYQRKRPLSPCDLQLLHALLTAPYPVVRKIRIGGFRQARSAIPSRSLSRIYQRELRALL